MYQSLEGGEAEVRVGGGAEDGKHYINAKRTNVSC